MDELFANLATRRSVLASGFGAGIFVCLSGCSEVQASPRPIKWGRETCEFCHMTFGDRRFSAEWWDGANHRARVFDDFGCAVLAADEAGVLNDPSIPFWVSDDGDPTKWLDARAAHFRDGVSTPMGYGHSAGSGASHALDFATAAATIRDKAACEHQPAGGRP